MKFPSRQLKLFDKDYLTTRVELFANQPVSIMECTLLKGDASDRKFYRVIYQLNSSPARPLSTIIMQLAEIEPKPAFNDMQKFLKDQGIPVPDIFGFDAERGLIFLMDCGDTHLADQIKNDPKNTVQWYKKAINIIVDFHTRTTENLTKDCPAKELFFDTEKLIWEMNFMLEHYVKSMLGNILSPDKKNKTRQALGIVCRTLSDQDRVFTHRDYHSRNIMVYGRNLKVIDFQDARMGPCQYDLASLLKDSYIVLEDSVRKELLEYYIESMHYVGKKIDRDPFYKIFDWMSVQRNLKAIGTFAYQSKVLGNDNYLQYIEPTLEYVRKTLHSRRDLEFLIPALNFAIPSLNNG
tara:strand:- start:350 stop:1402 length:1053 start_codon:yes stop_codon:yes gene_type:complete